MSFIRILKKCAKRILPGRVTRGIINVMNLRAVHFYRKPYQPGKFPEGVMLTGYIHGDFGLAQGCRGLAAGLEAAAIPYAVTDYNYDLSASQTDTSLSGKESDKRVDVNLTVINADRLYDAIPRLGRGYWDGQYQIAHYSWELPEYKAEWAKLSERFDEIWTPSSFCTEAIGKMVHRPVYTVPFVVNPVITEPRTRSDFGLPEGDFLFLCMLDVNSTTQRKNPKASVEAFLRAFGDCPAGVGLVVKVNNPQRDREAAAYLEELTGKHRNVTLIDRILSRNDVNALIGLCDVFVSMHRSEGFGLVCAEAMALGRPVIATGWSSTTDFMNAENSCPVSYRLVELEEDAGVYPRGSHWAEPDVDDCARYMRLLREDRAYYARLAENGQKTISEMYSGERVGKLIRERLDAIRQNGGKQ